MHNQNDKSCKTTTRKRGANIIKRVRNKKLAWNRSLELSTRRNKLLELSTTQRVVTWQHHKLHLQKASRQKEATSWSSQDYNEKGFARYHSSMA